MDDAGLRPFVAFAAEGSYESSYDTPQRPSALDCCYHLEVVQHLVDTIHHCAVVLHYLSMTSVELRLLLHLRVFVPFHLCFWWLKKLQPP
jgi:hypothetical protein